MKTETFKILAGEKCKIDAGKCGTTVEGPAIVVVVKEEATANTVAQTYPSTVSNGKDQGFYKPAYSVSLSRDFENRIAVTYEGVRLKYVKGYSLESSEDGCQMCLKLEPDQVEINY